MGQSKGKGGPANTLQVQSEWGLRGSPALSLYLCGEPQMQDGSTGKGLQHRTLRGLPAT